MRMVVFMIVIAAAMYGMARWLTRPLIEFDTFVETPEVWLELFNKYDGIESDRVRVTPRVNPLDRESVIRWPTFQSTRLYAAPVELRIRDTQWSDKAPVSDRGVIGPDRVVLALDWPEAEAGRARAPRDEEPPRVVYTRARIGRDVLVDEEFRAGGEVKYATPLDAPREEAVIVYCAERASQGCVMLFEHLGRPAQLGFPQRRLPDWREGYRRARTLIASIATPITRK